MPRSTRRPPPRRPGSSSSPCDSVSERRRSGGARRRAGTGIGGAVLITGHPAANERGRYRAIFISDIHLGTPGSKAEHLLDFLRHSESEHLYLVGDVVDGWQLKKRWYWTQAHNDVIQKVLRKARKGTQVTYIAGNHDEVMRHFLGVAFGDIRILDETEHHLADGRRLLVVHGDRFDAVVQRARWLALVGDQLYTLVLRVNHWFNHARAALGLEYWSLSQYLKHKTKNAVSFITDFERAVARDARERGYHGVVCGHIHKATIREIDGILYCNDGDWVESLSALVETCDGELKIVEWSRVPALTGTVEDLEPAEVLV